MAEARILYIATANGLVQLANPGKSDRWREIGRTLTHQDVAAVVASPNDALLIVAASNAGIARSDNGGMSWDRVTTEPARALVFDAAGTLYAGTERGALLSSADGVSWTEAAHTSAPIVQWALLPDGALLGVAADGRIYERDADQWQPRAGTLVDARNVAADPSDPQRLFVVADRSVHMVEDEHGLPAAATGAIVVLSGQQPVLLVGTQAALLRSDDRGASLVPVPGPQHVTVLVTPPRFIDQAFAGTATGALWFSADRGRSWAELRAGYAPIRGIAFARALYILFVMRRGSRPRFVVFWTGAECWPLIWSIGECEVSYRP
jgi:photosystem II stability/assembly factor-like uncharacterized protein